MKWISSDTSLINLDSCSVYYRKNMNKKAWAALSSAVSSTSIFYSFRSRKKATAIVFVSDTLIMEI